MGGFSCFGKDKLGAYPVYFFAQYACYASLLVDGLKALRPYFSMIVWSVPPPWLLIEQLLLAFDSALALKLVIFCALLLLSCISLCWCTFFLSEEDPAKAALKELVHPLLISLMLTALSSRLIPASLIDICLSIAAPEVYGSDCSTIGLAS